MDVRFLSYSSNLESTGYSLSFFPLSTKAFSILFYIFRGSKYSEKEVSDIRFLIESEFLMPIKKTVVKNSPFSRQ